MPDPLGHLAPSRTNLGEKTQGQEKDISDFTQAWQGLREELVEGYAG